MNSNNKAIKKPNCREQNNKIGARPPAKEIQNIKISFPLLFCPIFLHLYFVSRFPFLPPHPPVFDIVRHSGERKQRKREVFLLKRRGLLKKDPSSCIHRPFTCFYQPSFQRGSLAFMDPGLDLRLLLSLQYPTSENTMLDPSDPFCSPL
ncbi:hypothetical protein MRB53_028651 [Persea americana]|uniref:Uncharacterized protein n=1 Tax=Persea americana TaxID=3435 RepID=A0ACC2KGI0_PERAE|nr:hypothetical protein MRB53_028651 [Persea americana]